MSQQNRKTKAAIRRHPMLLVEAGESAHLLSKRSEVIVDPVGSQNAKISSYKTAEKSFVNPESSSVRDRRLESIARLYGRRNNPTTQYPACHVRLSALF
jgi:hypothetical protein